MSSGLFLNNLVSYCLQIGMLMALAACVPSLLRLRQPGARLAYWYTVLAACLLLPLAQPWKQAVIAGTVQITTVITAMQPVAHSSRFSVPRGEIALLVLAAGMFIRLFWLAVGFWKLRRFRRRSRPLDPAPAWAVEASLCLSEDVPSPVTFGWRRPVVLLPQAFPILNERVQDAILCHEILHVRRRDWLFTMFEELVRAVFWFHPAIWWLLGEIGLAREQEVDRLAIEITQQREDYMDALLAIAGARHHLDLAPAPLFLRKRHLKHRVVLILKEARMSKTRLISALAASVLMLAVACWLATGAFPLMAAPQIVNDAPGVTVGLGGAALMHRAPVQYPEEALRARVQGTLSVEVRMDAKGNVVDARVLSGPDELRKAALQSVLQWHFAGDSANTTRVVQITFELPKAEEVVEGLHQSVTVSAQAAGPVGGVAGGVIGGVPTGSVRGIVGGVIGAVPAGAPPPPPPTAAQLELMTRMRQAALERATPRPVKNIVILGLSDQARNELLARLPVHEGDTLTGDAKNAIAQAARDFDEHLATRFEDGSEGMSVVISAPGGQAPMPALARFKVGANVQAAMVLRRVQPLYPALAKSARVEGVVHLAALIAPDGTIQELHSLGGPALLIAAAMDAVKQWVYQPTMLNGLPVAVETTIDVNFTLNQ